MLHKNILSQISVIPFRQYNDLYNENYTQVNWKCVITFSYLKNCESLYHKALKEYELKFPQKFLAKKKNKKKLLRRHCVTATSGAPRNWVFDIEKSFPLIDRRVKVSLPSHAAQESRV